MSKLREVVLVQKPGQSKREALAEFNSKPELINTLVAETFDSGLAGEFDFQGHIEVLERAAKQIESGDLSKIEAMYISQATALQSIFAKLSTQAWKESGLTQYEAHMRLALKAQNQSRATLQALVELKQPNQTTFVKQANIANGHQQVNNLPEKNITPQNELLENSNERMDRRTQTASKRTHSELETVAKVYGRENTRRKNKVI